MKKIISLITILSFVFMAILIAGCQKKKGGNILGAGASFPYPVYAKMFKEYKKKTNVKVNYQSIGSGAGIQQLLVETVDFAASDSFLDKQELSKAKRELLHIPIVLGGIAITYNLAEIKNLKFDGKTLSKIFMGKITKWNNEEIVKLNPHLTLPEKDILVVRRSDSSSTTHGLSGFLAFSSAKWQNQHKTSKTINWFKGSIGAKGNEGVSGQVKNIEGSIGYISLNYAEALDLPSAYIKNISGNFIKPSITSVYEAAQRSTPEDTRINLNSSATMNDGYPISTFTWIIIYREQKYNDRSREKGKKLQNLLSWMVLNGQDYVQDLNYTPLPPETVSKALRIISFMSYNKKTL